jgi:prolyl oligopeptidase
MMLIMRIKIDDPHRYFSNGAERPVGVSPLKLIRTGVLSLLALAIAPPAHAGDDTPPATPQRPVVDTYHGVAVTDPLRWMEDMKQPEFRDWVSAQAAYARRQLDAIPGRAAMLQRLQGLSQAAGNIADLAWGGKHLFFLALEPGRNHWRLMVQENGTGTPRVLLDPEALSLDGQRLAIGEFTPSRDGSRVAVGLAAGGSEKSVLHVLDVKTGQLLADRIDRVYGGSWTVSWLADGQHFFYVRAPEGERYNKTRVHLHRLGRPADEDPAVFGFGVHAEHSFEPGDYTYLRLAPDGRHVVAVTVPGVANTRHFFTAPLPDVVAGRAQWRRLAGPADQWFRGYLAGRSLYVLSHQAAPRNKLLKVDLDKPQAAPELVLPAGTAVLDDAAVARDGIYVKGLDAGVAKLFRVPFGKGAAQEVMLPFPGSIREIAGSATRDGVLLKMEGWTHSQRVLAADLRAVRDTALLAPAPADFSGIDSKRLFATGHDGVRIPVTVIHRKGLALDGARPTLLNAYGAYGFSEEPRFNAMNLAWLERGGVIAVAHVRGGGEYGEEWHRAGQLLTKSNTILDMVACAETLIQQRYTQPAKLAARGVSAGGIAVAGAITERPELFAAAHHAVGVADLLRAENELVGAANIPELGTVKKRYQFLAMLPVSPYHRVVDRTAYPAVIVTTGINDPRVQAWQPAKLAARLQAASSSGKPVLLRVEMDGGHGMGGTRRQRIEETADVWSFLLSALGEPEFARP